MAEAFHLDARLKSADGSKETFSLHVSAPRYIEPGKYGCTISCVHFPFDGREFYGSNARQAMALSLWLIEDQLRHMEKSIISADGEAIKLPIDRDAGIPEAPVG